MQKKELRQVRHIPVEMREGGGSEAKDREGE